MDNFRTDQENFWAGSFGGDYVERNQDPTMVRANEVFFERILAATTGVSSVVELGCNIGLNLIALQHIRPELSLRGYEINAEAAEKARATGIPEIVNQSVTEPIVADRMFDLAFTKGVLIHINPDALDQVYANLAVLSTRYVLVCEYYNPTPVTISYRGHENRLFKRDFAGELLDRHNVQLIDYGFVYRRDPTAPQDDITWFLMEKNDQQG